MFGHVSILGIVLAALGAMVVGMLWYSPFVFGKEWSRLTGVSEKSMKAKRPTAIPILVVVSLVTAYALSLVIDYLHAFAGGGWWQASMAASLLTGIGFACTALFAHGLFEVKSKKLLYINSGNRIVTFVVMGLILAAFLK